MRFAALFGRTSSSRQQFRGRLIRPPHVMSTTRDGETVLLDTVRGRYHTLNAVGTRVWELLADGTTLEEIVGTVRREYDVPLVGGVDPVEPDVTTLLTHLRAAGLLVTDPVGGVRRES
jgi:Coenzyme PQQ synthesis protein D (PqqD)